MVVRAQDSEAGRRELGSDFYLINSPLPAVGIYVRGEMDGVSLHRVWDGDDIWMALLLEWNCFEQCHQVNALID